MATDEEVKISPELLIRALFDKDDEAKLDKIGELYFTYTTEKNCWLSVFFKDHQGKNRLFRLIDAHLSGESTDMKLTLIAFGSVIKENRFEEIIDLVDTNFEKKFYDFLRLVVKEHIKNVTNYFNPLQIREALEACLETIAKNRLKERKHHEDQ